MIIEIRMAGFVNKGAELMLLATVSKLREQYPNAKLVMAPVFGGSEDTYEKMIRLGFYLKAWYPKYGVDFGSILRFVPKKYIRKYGLILDDEVDVIIDIAGYAYGGKWGSRYSSELAHSSKKWGKANKCLILMPQALGGFDSQRTRQDITEIVKNADLVFARESESYSNVIGVVGNRDNLKMSPDFTNQINGVIPGYYDPKVHGVAIVPNYRMLDKTDASTRETYLPKLIHIGKRLHEHGMRPFVLVHEGKNDYKIGKEISMQVSNIPVVVESDALHIKGLIGVCEASVGSRYHGLVSALSQGVPALALGWSFKYEMLYDDYGFQEGMIANNISYQQLDIVLEKLIDSTSRENIRARLVDKSIILKHKSEEMWQQVFCVIDTYNKEL